jgi:hypothetical protein
VHELESEYYNLINFVYLDIDDPSNDIFKEQFKFRYQPHLYLIDGNGEIIQQWVGPVPREELASAFDQLLSR